MNTPAAPARRRLRFGLRARLWLLATAVAALSASLALLVQSLSGEAWLARGAGIVGGALVGALLLDRLAAPALSLFRALAGVVTAYRDGDFAFDIAWEHDDELRELVDAHNALGQTLRSQRQRLVQRELLLDTMVQNTPVAMLLADAGGRVAYANLAARRLLHGGRPLEGVRVDTVLAAQPPALAEAMRSGRDGLCTVPGDDPSADEDESFHVLAKDFQLGGRAHRLLLVRRFTGELRRQEVRTWKKVIRVISHELNNSLAPIASMAYSGGELLRRGETERLPDVLGAIGERARHLEGFIRGYADVARLPAPRPEPIDWPAFVQRLQVQVAFRTAGELPVQPLQADPAQLAQALLNLLKNAHESGSDPAAIYLRAQALPGEWRLEVTDRGSGMSEAVLAQALVPFYSTKRGGTGLGLALVREIVEAHGGRIALARRDGGGTQVTLVLPA
ncbi:sensor histidine kinase [Rubrivivax albus]|uniref:histidine kinase n=1 Tax=Rubrivivax albus TaxID=2499835 RepID=A0A437JZB9_9BURK|nr:ATP-binding protein [Rubrivivax albus]RVT53381.1 ATP-binding protein [Rubrivivax albus]